jgi:hypothetical protein
LDGNNLPAFEAVEIDAETEIRVEQNITFEPPGFFQRLFQFMGAAEKEELIRDAFFVVSCHEQVAN